jgi:hypothetical protein
MKHETNHPIKWYNYLTTFATSFFGTNVIPHLVSGGTGNSFPTPFANPPGKGLSSPLINVLWACANILIAYTFFRFSNFNSKNKYALIALYLGVLLASILHSFSFAK